MTDSLDALAELDSLYARARYAIAVRVHARATLVPARAGFDDSHRPSSAAAREGRSTSSRSISRWLAEERTLLVSGPNTGGKTVLLKALGLISAMSQAGIPAPVGAESRMPVFDDVLRRRRRRAIDRGEPLDVQRAPEEPLRDPPPRDPRFTRPHRRAGSGTDPQEGAALGWAILESLTSRGATTLASTHLGQLKELATAGAGVVNASLQFDAVRSRRRIVSSRASPAARTASASRGGSPFRRKSSRAPKSACRRASATWRR